MNKIVERDHEAQREAWAAGWFLSLMKARRLGGDVERPQAGLDALGIQVLFAEDESPEPSTTKPAESVPARSEAV